MSRVSFGMSGADVIAILKDVARDRGIGFTEFVRPFTARQPNWVTQVGSASRPRADTIERVNALIAGRDIPPPTRTRSLPQGPHRRGIDIPARERERWGAPDLWHAPTPSIGTIAADDQSLADRIRAEAHRLGLPLTSFLCDLVALGFRCHLEDVAEAARP